jgi:hypothetical protein
LWRASGVVAVAVSVQGAEAAAKVAEFVHGKAAVLIISYEMLRKHAGALCGADATARVGLLIADEAHRLKSAAGNKTIAALESLATRRRVLLTGTPLQNNLGELFALCSFACPGVLGSLAQFKLAFAAPIEKGRDKAATPAQAHIAAERSAAMADKIRRFVLRRTSDVLDRYLPPKTEAALFVRLAPLQVALYRAVVGSQAARSAAGRGGGGGGGAGEAQVLVVLNALRQVCAHPDLLHPSRAAGSSGGGGGGGSGGGGSKSSAAASAMRTAAAAALPRATVGFTKRKRVGGEGGGGAERAGGSSDGEHAGADGDLASIKAASQKKARRGTDDAGAGRAAATARDASDGSDSEGSLRDFIERGSDDDDEEDDEEDDDDGEGSRGGRRRGAEPGDRLARRCVGVTARATAACGARNTFLRE